MSEHTNILNTYFPKKNISRDNFVLNQFTNKALIKVILYAVEDYLRPKSEVKVSTSSKDVDIEHILPLNPDKKSNWLKSFTEDDHKDYKDRIGNVTLLYAPINRKVSNSDFKNKREKYKESQLYLNKEIIKVKIWNKQAIKQRSVDLFSYAMKIWEYPS
ncbi:MAG: HNH endonuclease family protein [Candidatus Bathyarchaeota archaeon]|nr:HNH endonuclease family protein [Candidatus Bathyarchaeota archaeon]